MIDHRSWLAEARDLARPSLLAAVVCALVLLILHVQELWFLTDDAFIAFRYARNLSQGHGLVFNPGHEAVEGFTSLLWVLILALFDRLGAAPEHVANILSCTATLVVWLMVANFCLTRPGSARAPWLVLLPAFGLASNRNFAVWATGGMETRWFEAFVVLGVLRLVQEQRREEGGPRIRSLAPWAFALAFVTRPEGALAAFMAMLAVVTWRRPTGLQAWLRLGRAWVPVVVVVVATTLFRLVYFHDWVPNTWHAKIGGEFFWATGLRYLAAFALEYSAWLWLPFIVIAPFARRDGRSFLVWLCALIVVPHLLYVTAIGGDHFEYRPLGLETLLAFVLMHDVALRWAITPRARAIVAGLAVVILGGMAVIPWTSHLSFPSDYRTGFPGAQLQSEEGERFLDPATNPITRLPGLSWLAARHRDLTRTLTARLVAIRQEEHRLFAETVIPAGRELAALLESGVLPRDLYVAVDCVGAIPYYSGVRVLDRLGLTDARVARGARAGEYQAHWRFATLEYARERGVDLWADDRVHLVCGLDSRPMLRALNSLGDGENRYVADLGRGRFLLVRLPLGPEAVQRRLPAVRFSSLSDPAFLRSHLLRVAMALIDSLPVRPQGAASALRIAQWFRTTGDPRGAIDVLEGLIARGMAPVTVLEELAFSQAAIGEMDSARATLLKAYMKARSSGDLEFLERWHLILRGVGADSAERGGSQPGVRRP